MVGCLTLSRQNKEPRRNATETGALTMENGTKRAWDNTNISVTGMYN